MGCDDPPIYKETVRQKMTDTEKDEDETVQGDENQKDEQIEGDTANTEETVTKKGCAIATPLDTEKLSDYRNMCEGVKTVGEQKETIYPWFKLCCTWIEDEHECKPDTGQNSVSKGIFLKILLILQSYQNNCYEMSIIILCL